MKTQHQRDIWIKAYIAAITGSAQWSNEPYPHYWESKACKIADTALDNYNYSVKAYFAKEGKDEQTA